ncbi:MAG: type III-A CRISPR-associated RAMP protein Csm5 [Deltaproteobacteria bacterium]|nr:type III-A CRISPR-associated RAMP protein Csm5 [Deltaproteobacteria bacterium]
MKEPDKFYIRTISPIHVGCDEVYEPTGFTIDEKECRMVVFDPFSFVSQLNDGAKQEFSKICAKGTIASILEIYKFLDGKPVQGRYVEVCHGVLEHYKQTLGLPLNNETKIRNELNRFEIPRTTFRSIDQRPYIPGSAIKGALRTAYLNQKEAEKQLSKRGKERDAKKLEQQLMEYDGIPSDPFRMVKVSDFSPVGEAKTRIVYAINQKKKPTGRDARGIPLIFEIIEPGTLFQGTITVDTPQKGAGINEPVTLSEILKSALTFYGKEGLRENGEMKGMGVAASSVEDPSKENAVTFRIGRHSGAESVTIEGHRDIFIMGGKGKKSFKDHATTLWLVSESRKPTTMNNLAPFGWSQLCRLTDDLAQQFQTTEQEWHTKKDEYRSKQHQETERQAELVRQAEEAAKREAIEEEEKQKEEAREKAQWEKMTPEERDIATLADPEINEQQVFEIFGRIDGFPEENKKAVALSLKSYWEGHGKWNKKDCSKKQWAKVQKIKGILSEV